MGDTDRQPTSDVDRRIRQLEKKVEEQEKNFNDLRIEVKLQADRVKELHDFKDALKDMTKSLDTLKMDFVKLRTQILTVASMPSALFVVYEIVKALVAK